MIDHRVTPLTSNGGRQLSAQITNNTDFSTLDLDSPMILDYVVMSTHYLHATAVWYQGDVISSCWFRHQVIYTLANGHQTIEVLRRLDELGTRAVTEDLFASVLMEATL